jgi:hypothetical protein
MKAGLYQSALLQPIAAAGKKQSVAKHLPDLIHHVFGLVIVGMVVPEHVLNKGQVTGQDHEPVAGEDDGISIPELVQIGGDGFDSAATKVAQAAKDKSCGIVSPGDGILFMNIHARSFRRQS